MPKISKVTIWDIPALCKVFYLALEQDFNYFSEPYRNQIKSQNSPKRFLAAIYRRHRMFLVAKTGSQIVGYAIGAVPKPGEGELYWLYVSPDQRGQNLGLKLLAASFKSMRQLGAKKVRIVTYNFDKYYYRQGFQHVGTQAVDGLELKRMEYPLFPETKPDSGRYDRLLLLLILLTVVGAAVYLTTPYQPTDTPPTPVGHHPGRIIKIVDSHHFTPAEVTGLVRQNYGDQTPATTIGATRVLFTYSSQGANNRPISIYARAYLPDGQSSSPLLALAPGTTGIGDQCAPSLEQPELKNWANYESHALAYTSQGYSTVVTDYEGQRDPGTLNHYMLGELEGRAVLDSLRATKSLPAARGLIDPKTTFISGYSQGGHSAFWADKIAKSYAPDIKLAGIIGWNPVMDVKQTWQDITKGANINWFGPYILASYGDFYKQNYNVQNILLPRWNEHLLQDVTAHCIDSDIEFWGRVPAHVYTPEFIANLASGQLSKERYGTLSDDLAANLVTGEPTPSAKLVNYGLQDNVVLPAQQLSAKLRLCTGSHGSVIFTPYEHDTHYTVMKSSLTATLQWMQSVRSGAPPVSTCN